MNGWELAAPLTVASVVAFDVGFLTTLILTRRHYAKRQALGCIMCDRPVAEDRATCSLVCQDMWLGQIGVNK